MQSAPAPSAQRIAPRHEVVTAGMVDGNADFGEYLATASTNAGLPVRERDIAERYLLEVTDAARPPVHDAEVAIATRRPRRASDVGPHRYGRARVAAPCLPSRRGWTIPRSASRCLGLGLVACDAG